MHTNDIHGSYKYSYNASKGTGTIGFDGLAVLYSAQSNAPDFLLDAGDTFHGQSFATMSEGKSIAELMNTFYANGYDATTPGNHDWSYGADKLRTMAGNGATSTPFAMLCANATSSNGVWSSSITKTLNRTWKDGEGSPTFNYKIKVGVVGAMDESLAPRYARTWSRARRSRVRRTPSMPRPSDCARMRAATLSSASRTRSTPRPLLQSSLGSMHWSRATSTST